MQAVTAAKAAREYAEGAAATACIWGDVFLNWN